MDKLILRGSYGVPPVLEDLLGTARHLPLVA